MTTSGRKGSPKAWSSRRSTALFTVRLQAPHLSGPASPQSTTGRSSPQLRRRHPHFFCSMPPGSVPSLSTPFRPTTHATREGLGPSQPWQSSSPALALQCEASRVVRACVLYYKIFCGTKSFVPQVGRTVFIGYFKNERRSGVGDRRPGRAHRLTKEEIEVWDTTGERRSGV